MADSPQSLPEGAAPQPLSEPGSGWDVLEQRLREEEAVAQRLREERDGARRTCVVRQVRDMQAEIDHLKAGGARPAVWAVAPREDASEQPRIRLALSELAAAQEDARSVRAQLEEERRAHRLERSGLQAKLAEASRQRLGEACGRLQGHEDQLQPHLQQDAEPRAVARGLRWELEAREAGSRLQTAESELEATRKWVERRLDVVEDERQQLQRHSQRAVRCLQEENNSLRESEALLEAKLGRSRRRTEGWEESVAGEMGEFRQELEGLQVELWEAEEAERGRAGTAAARAEREVGAARRAEVEALERAARLSSVREGYEGREKELLRSLQAHARREEELWRSLEAAERALEDRAQGREGQLQEVADELLAADSELADFQRRLAVVAALAAAPQADGAVGLTEGAMRT